MEPIKIMKKLNESYDMGNVVQEVISDLERLKGLIDDGTFNDVRVISKDLELIIKNTKDNMSEAW